MKRPRRGNPIVTTAKRDAEVQTDPVIIIECDTCDRPTGTKQVPEPTLNNPQFNWFSLNASVKDGHSPSKRDTKLDDDRYILQTNDSAPQFGGRRIQKKNSKERAALSNLISKQSSNFSFDQKNP